MEESADKEYSSESDTGDYSGYACEPKHSHEELKTFVVGYYTYSSSQKVKQRCWSPVIPDT